jgi:CheY-like chemotaxis protein
MPNLILIVDDNPDDSELLQRFLRKKGVANPIRVLPDGSTAIDYLHGLKPYSDRTLYPFPALVFLDLSMPGKSGYDVLEWLSTDPGILSPKIIIFTEAIGFEELERCYLLGADSFLLKQTMEEQFRDLLVRYPDVWEFADPATLLGSAPRV